MSALDYIVILFYIVGIFIMGGIFSGRIKNSKDMFAAGGQSPWWVSGLSNFMTMFSAPWLVRLKGHVFVESVVRLLPPLGRRLAARFVYSLCILLCLTVAWFALIMGWEAFLRGDFVDDITQCKLGRDWVEHLQSLFKIEGQWRTEYLRELLSRIG